jgi:hypothetical protein
MHRPHYQLILGLGSACRYFPARLPGLNRDNHGIQSFISLFNDAVYLVK